jgi:hypothetical protein
VYTLSLHDALPISVPLNLQVAEQQPLQNCPAGRTLVNGNCILKPAGDIDDGDQKLVIGEAIAVADPSGSVSILATAKASRHPVTGVTLLPVVAAVLVSASGSLVSRRRRISS